MDVFETLSTKEQYELDVCRKNIDLFSKYIKDYESLKTKLITLTEKTRHDIMVPIGGTKYALMPGYIHHTNEILVLIGDNYFVEKSTKEALHFIDRRIKFCNEKLNELAKQQTMLQQWLATSQDLNQEANQFVNITEFCTEEEFDDWMKEHQNKLKMQNDHLPKRDSENDKTYLEKIFEKYEKSEKQSPIPTADMDTKQTEPLIESKIVEKTNLQQMENRTSSTVDQSQSQRPVSKFKASRSKLK